MNKKFLKHYMETNPEGTAQTYIFLVDNQDIALNIVMSGYQALCLVQEDEELRSFLIQEYGTGGKGFEFSGQKFSVWYDGDGMRFRRGESARHNYDRMLTWEEAANRIQDMYDAGTYVSNVIMKNSIKVECDELSSQLALHFRDTGAIRGIYSHTETTERFRAGLDDPEQTREYYQMLVELERDMERHPENYMRYQIRNR